MIIACASIKGGVGKTTTAVNLATIFSQYKKTLLIDTDFQQSCKLFFNISKKNNFYTTQYSNLTILEDKSPNLEKLKKEFEIIIIDTPAGINKKNKKILNNTDLTIVPVLPSILSLNTYNLLIDKGFKNIKILLNGIEKKTLHKKIVNLILKLPKNQYFRCYIPKSEKIEELPFLQKNIFEISPSSLEAKAYKKLFYEINQNFL